VRYGVTFETTAEFYVVIDTEDEDTAEDLVSGFSPEVNWDNVSISDFGMYDLEVIDVTCG